VNNLGYSSEVNPNGQVRIDLGAPVAAAAAGIMSAVSIASPIVKGGTLVAAFDPDKHMGAYGRNVTFVLGAAGTPNVTIRGRDYLGQPMSETAAATGTTPVVGKKAFKTIDNISVDAGVATTINVGYGTVLGFPYAMLKISEEYQDNAAASAGTVALAVATQTASSGDPRGTYVPANAPNGTRNYYLIGTADQNQLHGAAHFTN
jgi:hypothetical protein